MSTQEPFQGNNDLRYSQIEEELSNLELGKEVPWTPLVGIGVKYSQVEEGLRNLELGKEVPSPPQVSIDIKYSQVDEEELKRDKIIEEVLIYSVTQPIEKMEEVEKEIKQKFAEWVLMWKIFRRFVTDVDALRKAESRCHL